ncbi:MAG: tyrosine--tRNA ligase [Bacilli bacterium]|nr:tyrosine--tRNA ligase [Bacilli bacterium]
MEKKAFDLIKERGYIYQATKEKEIEGLINGEPMTFYLGIDPTADSLHIGHFFALTMVRRLQKMGHHPIIVIGGATALIGDPSGRQDMRSMLTKEQVDHNKKEVKELVKRFVDIEGDNPAIILDNADWINQHSYIDFMRNVGAHFNVNKMLSTDCYKKRLEQGGLTFLEMGYMLMQAYDFEQLNRDYGCTLEIGGSDQWANMIAGVELARKIDYQNGDKERGLQAVTCPLLVKADGEKMGKTSSGTLWVSRNKTTVYDFYQMFINSYDQDVERLLSFFSDFEIEDIRKMCATDIIQAKKIMAFEVTKLVHGEEEAIKVKDASEAIFNNGINVDNVPSYNINRDEFREGIDLADLMVKINMAKSKSEVRRLLEQGGIYLNNLRVIQSPKTITEEDIVENALVLKRGKKNYMKVIVKD